MRRNGSTVAVLTAAVFLAGPVLAADPDPAAIAAADRLQLDSRTAQTTDIVLQLMRKPLTGLMTAHGLNDDQARRTYDELLLPSIRSHLPELRHELSILFAQKMSAAELDAVDAFYRSPVGRKFIATQADVLAGSGPVIAAWGQRIATEVIQENRQALQQRGVLL